MTVSGSNRHGKHRRLRAAASGSGRVENTKGEKDREKKTRKEVDKERKEREGGRERILEIQHENRS